MQSRKKDTKKATRILHEYHGETHRVGVLRNIDEVVRWMCDERECHGCPSRSSMCGPKARQESSEILAEARILAELLDKSSGLTLLDLENLGYDITEYQERRFNRNDTSSL